MSIFLFAIALFASPLSRADTACHGYFLKQGGFLNGNCNGGNCSAFMSSDFISGTASCGSGLSVRYEGNVPGGFVNGRCNGSSISIYVAGGSMPLRGNCSDGATFSGNATTTGGFLNGNCTENGSFSIFLPSEQVQFSGACR